MPDFVSSILMLLFWLFIVNAITKFFKKMFGKANEAQPANKGGTQKPQSTFQEMMREIQKKIEDAQTGQNIPPYSQPEVVIAAPEKPVVRPQQTLTKHKETGAEKAKRSAAEYENFVKKERRKEHDAEESRLTNKIYAIKSEEETTAPFELDLRNAIIGSIILEQPHSYRN